MAIATATAIAIGLAGAKIGTDIYASKKAAGAAKDAAKVQEKGLDAQDKAAREALALQRGIYEQTRADTAPYRNVGGQSMNSLGYLMGLPAGPVQGPNADPGPLVPSLQSAIDTTTTTAPQAETPDDIYKRTFLEAYRSYEGSPFHRFGAARDAANAARDAGTNPTAPQPQQQASATGYSGTGGVPIRTPSGRVVMIPADRVGEAEAKGGQRV